MGIRFKGSPKLLCNIFFVSTLNSLDGVLCSVIVSEWLKMRKFYGIHYYQDTISGVEVSNNVININKLWEVSTSFVILYYFWFQHYFFQSWKIEFSKDLGAVGCSPPPVPPVSMDLSVYRKPPFSGVHTHFESFLPTNLIWFILLLIVVSKFVLIGQSFMKFFKNGRLCHLLNFQFRRLLTFRFGVWRSI